MTIFRCSVAHLIALVLFLCFAMLQAGCGGGGGGVANVLLYQTDWTNRGNNITGLSQRVQVRNEFEVLLASVTVNQDADGLQQVTISGLGVGKRHLHVDLFSARDLGGVQTGELDVWINISGTTLYRTGVGDTMNSLKVSPPSATFTVGQSSQFYATAHSSPGQATFIGLNTLTWATFGGVATVNSEGLVEGTSPGNGTVRATHTPSGFQGSATLDIQPFNATTSRWTVLVYLNAANDLAQFGPLNVNQMETVADVPANSRIVVQWKQVPSMFPSSEPWSGTRRYLIKPDTTNNIQSELLQDMGSGVDMGDKQTLNDFIQWGRTFYPADRYVLVVWNHGNGWRRGQNEELPTRAVSYDDETGNAIQTWELSQAIGNVTLDIVAWDASLMQMLEVAHEIKDRALFVVGSEESPPGEGYPYDLIFDDFRDNPLDTTKNLTRAFVDGMLAVPGYASRKITQSSIETSKLATLASAVSTLATELMNAIPVPVEVWTSQGYSNLAAAHDRATFTFASNPAVSNGDHLTVTFPQQYVHEVELITSTQAAVNVQYQDVANAWQTVASGPLSGTVSNPLRISVGQQAKGIRLIHTAAGGSASVTEVRLPIEAARANAQSYSPTTTRVYRDLFHLCQLLDARVGVGQVSAAALAVRTAILDAVVWEGHNSNSPNSHGVAIDFSPFDIFNSGGTSGDYSLLRLSNETQWNEWLTRAP